MAMYYYASKLNEATCSGCNTRTPSVSNETTPVVTSAFDHSPLPTDPALLHGSALSYYDNEDYYSMVRGSKFAAEGSCKHLVMNGGVNCVTTQPKPDERMTGSKPLPLPPDPVDKPEVEYKDGQIVTATLDTLIDMLKPGVGKSFAFTFLLCSRLFIKPNELLGKLCKRYFKNYDKIGKEMRDLEVVDMGALVKILRMWTSTFPYDFRDERVMALVKNITQRCAADHMASMRDEVSVLLQKLLEKLTALEKYEETLVETPQVTNVSQLEQGDILTLGLTPIELASQLTSVELHRLSFIGPEEFVQTFAPSQNNQAAASFGTGLHSDLKTTKNLEAYADWFNNLSYLVATDIVKSPKTKYRARVMEQWVMTARECFNLGNFNSLMAIISALNMAPITRLKKTWGRTSAVCGQQLRQLELCIEPSSNHARYRSALAAAPTDTAVPLLSVTCRDLHFANQGSPSKINNRVNFEKCRLLSRHVNSALARRHLVEDEGAVVTPPPTHPPVWRYLNHKPILGEHGIELASYEREPPCDSAEKERLKRLRLST